jgi:hypothetical protein
MPALFLAVTKHTEGIQGKVRLLGLDEAHHLIPAYQQCIPGTKHTGGGGSEVRTASDRMGWGQCP